MYDKFLILRLKIVTYVLLKLLKAKLEGFTTHSGFFDPEQEENIASRQRTENVQFSILQQVPQAKTFP